MGEFKLTPAQQAVVDHRGSSLLVSAAAGSGKTKVLVDRMLNMVCDPVNPKNVDEFLIITYTSAAASELRGKIASAISERLSADPENRHLQRQMSRLYLTQISTVHAFCSTLLRTYANEAELPQDFRVADNLEAELLRQDSVQKTLDDCYAHLKEHPAQLRFLDTLALARDDRKATDLILRMSDYALCHTDPEQWIRDQIRELREDSDVPLLETTWGKRIYQRLRHTLDSAEIRINRAIAICESHPRLAERYLKNVAADLKVIEELRMQKAWDNFAAHSHVSFRAIGSIPKSEVFPEKIQVAAMRDAYKQDIKKALEIFEFTSEQALQMQRETSESMIGLLELVTEFQLRYAQEKRRRRVVDFSDLEHGAIRLLVQRNTGKPTALARKESQRYCQIMVDEYQDTNAVQDLIFRAISQDEQNLFMVGDVKQSIYRFRLADPSIFLGKYHAFPPSETAKKGEPCKILLSENFRSDDAILDAANCVFSGLMSPEVGGLYYGPSEALKAGLTRPGLGRPAVELYCIDEQRNETRSDDEDELNKTEIEASFVANRVAELLREPPSIPDGDSLRCIRPGDIAILLRAAKSDGPYYMEALRKAGIRAVSESGQKLMESMEVESVASILRVIDNPHQDIPLLSAMTSPAFRVSNDTVAQVRARHRKMNLFDAVCAEQTNFPELEKFVEALRDLQKQSCVLKLHELYRLMEDRLSLRTVFGAMPQGKQRLQNLDAFYDMISRFEENGEKSLSQLCVWLERLSDRDIEAAAETGGENCVLIQTIHRSKGLEYPVVILAGLSKRFNQEDSRQSVLIHPELGAACDYVSERLRFRCATPAKRIIAEQINADARSEEMRVLYVAMTRPRHRLIMTCCASKLLKHLDDLGYHMIGMGMEEAASRANCMGDWVLMTALRMKKPSEIHEKLTCETETDLAEHAWQISYCEADRPFEPEPICFHAAEADGDIELPNERQLRDRLCYTYPHEPATRLPTKLTATQLKGRAIDFESAEQALPVETKVHFRFDRPDFTAEERGLTPTQRGTATHLAMQFIRYENCTDFGGVKSELERLRQERYLTQQQYEAVSPQTLWSFFSSTLGREVAAAKKVVREFKFSLFVDGGFLSEDASGVEILLQGVTDCCVLDGDGMTIIDFKTDRVREGGEAEAASFYAGQMKAYAMALSRIFARPVKRKLLYFFATGTWVEM